MRAAAAGSQRAAGVNENPDSSRDEEARRRATAGKAASPGPPRRAARVCVTCTHGAAGGALCRGVLWAMGGSHRPRTACETNSQPFVCLRARPASASLSVRESANRIIALTSIPIPYA